MLPQEQAKVRKFETKMLVTIAMLSAVAYVAAALGRIPVIMFLKYDPKDIIIVLAGFIYGPLVSFLMAIVVAFVEMVTVGTSGIIGFVMNALASAAYCCPAAYAYRRVHTKKGAFIGLATGTVVMTAVMILWNYLLTPLYMDMPREKVIPLLTSAILPFNLVKGALNAGLTLLLYKPIVSGLRKACLIAPTKGQANKIGSLSITIISLLIIVTCVLLILVMNKVI